MVKSFCIRKKLQHIRQWEAQLTGDNFNKIHNIRLEIWPDNLVIYQLHYIVTKLSNKSALKKCENHFHSLEIKSH